MCRTVLIVDDHPSFRASARCVLESEGFEVVGEAADGASALTECCRLRPEVVLLDVQLPDTDGFDVCSQITAHAEHPVVIMTSKPSDSSTQRALARKDGWSSTMRTVRHMT